MFLHHLPVRRMLAFTTALSLVVPLAPPAFAQDAAPPSRVGQIAGISGEVSFNGASSGGWAAAALNYPVSNGDSLYTQSGAQAAVALDSSKLTLAGNTELQITQLDDENFAATESQGEVFLTISNLQQGQNFTIATPRGSVNIAQDGQYDIAAGDTNTPTLVNVFQGAATVTDPGATLNVPAGQAGVLSGTDQTVAQLGQAQPDGFANTLLAQNAPPPPSYVPPVAQQMTGVSELNQYGSWDQSPQYGAVWYPQVDSGWAPYREGHWANVQPWGWTWVDSAPWGFAPFHYGRWVQVGPRWGWAPAPAYHGGGDYGPSYRPIYAPAVVSFFGVALAAGITAAALSSGSVGWVPLGPEEPYYPTYRSSPDYIRRINVVNVRNINIVNEQNNYYGGGHFAPDHFANQRGATYIQADQMSRGEPVARYGRPVDPHMFAGARPVDAGFGARPAGEPGFRLPQAGAPLARERPGAAPQPTAFAERHTMPPAMISHQPPAMGPNGFHPPEAVNHPAFGMNPAYRAPPPPPAMGQHPGPLPAAQGYHPPEPGHPQMPQVYNPSMAPHPEGPQVIHPQGEQPFHPQAEPPMMRPQAAQQPFHPQAAPQPYHPPQEQRPAPPPQMYHPEMAPRPQPSPQQMRPQQVQQPRPEAPRPEAPRPAPQHEEQKPQHPQ